MRRTLAAVLAGTVLALGATQAAEAVWPPNLPIVPNLEACQSLKRPPHETPRRVPPKWRCPWRPTGPVTW